MPETKETVILLLDPRARPAKLSLKIGPRIDVRSGRRKNVFVSDLIPFTDAVIDYVKKGNLRVYSEGLKQLSLEEVEALLGGKAAPAPKKKEEPAPEKVVEPEPTAEEPEPVLEPEPEPEPEPPTEDAAPKKTRSKKSRSRS